MKQVLPHFFSVVVVLLLTTLSADAFQTVRYTPAHTATLCSNHRTPTLRSTGSSSSKLRLSQISSSRSSSSSKPSVSRKQRLTLALSTDNDSESEGSSNNNEEDAATSKMEKKVKGRKKRVMMGYRLTAVIYSVLGLSTLAPMLARPSFAPFALFYAGSPVLAAGIAYILSGAAENDRLSSETYQRLNFVLSQYGLLWLVSAYLIKGSTRDLVVTNPLVIFASLSAFINGLKGWAYGAKGWDKAANTTFAKELISLVKNALKVVVSKPKNIRATLYLATTLFALFLKVTKIWEIVTMLSISSVTEAMVATRLLAYAKIVLLGTSALTLLDAANRDRLKGTTFIELNVLSSFVWLGMGGKQT